MHCELLLCQLLGNTASNPNACLCSVHYQLPPRVLTSKSSVPGSMSGTGHGPTLRASALSFHLSARVQHVLATNMRQTSAPSAA